MDGSAIESWRAGMSQITDVRVGGRCEHLLIDVVGLTILAVLCGADGFVAVETFAVGRSVGASGCNRSWSCRTAFRHTTRSVACWV